MTNQEKCNLFASTLFPLPPQRAAVPGDFKYLEPYPTSSPITRDQIRHNIAKLSPYKACGEDGIPNVVLKKICHVIEDHLLYLF